METIELWGPEAQQIVNELSVRLVEAAGEQRAGN